jgi:hypothetical protein
MKTPRANSQQLVRHGWSVAIRSEDGTEFLASTGLGIGRVIWPLSYRANAVKLKRGLKANGLKARVVRVEYTDPKILPTAKRSATSEDAR